MRSMIRNKKGAGIIGSIILFLFFLIVYFVFLSSWLSEVGSNYITTTGAVGFEAFMYANLNLWVMLIVILAMLGWQYLGGEG